ncbi:MltA domain-containing protein [Devosia sp.]|uniref:MltA domain-containing protein n=1 Tax=Devosia sp. TaxID=1871048 RepID=UPI002FCAF11F
MTGPQNMQGSAMPVPVMEVRNLSVVARTPAGERPILSGIDLSVTPRSVLGIIGESGSGKTVLSRALVNWIKSPLSITGGSVNYGGRDLLTLPAEQMAGLRGREIAYVADPLDALVLQIQGSGRLRIAEADGSQRTVRLAFAGTNDQPYRSVGNWLLSQGALRDASWPGIKAWTVQNPQRVNEMLWSNPRTVFFREEALSELDAAFGPRGAQGVPLTPGRSIAVDRDSIPYGTPVWLASSGPLVNLQKLVLAQDTGSAIVGAVRADYFAGTGGEAGDMAGRLKQPLRLWVLWPK